MRWEVRGEMGWEERREERREMGWEERREVRWEMGREERWEERREVRWEEWWEVGREVRREEWWEVGWEKWWEEGGEVRRVVGVVDVCRQRLNITGRLDLGNDQTQSLGTGSGGRSGRANVKPDSRDLGIGRGAAQPNDVGDVLFPRTLVLGFYCHGSNPSANRPGPRPTAIRLLRSSSMSQKNTAPGDRDRVNTARLEYRQWPS